MPNPKGSHLYVNVGPSEARRRLQGFGHGVRKVQSAGRNQAVIIHTATGQHLTELAAKFADVGFSESERDLNITSVSRPAAASKNENTGLARPSNR